MADYKVTDTQLVQIADAIRSKGGTSASIVFPSGFISAVEAIPSGTSMSLISKEISENGTYLPSSDNADAFSSVVVDVPTGGGGVYVSKTITENGTYKPSDDNADAYSQVVVNVSGGGGSDDYYKIVTGQSSGGINDSSITVIAPYLFYNNDKLEWFVGNSVSLIDEYAFARASISYAIFPSCTYLSDYCFFNCALLETIDISRVSFVSQQCFVNCYSLKSIFLPEVSVLHAYVFRSCYNLSVAWFEKLSYISGSSVFANCSSLKSLYLLSTSVVSVQRNNIFLNTPMSTSISGVYGSIYVLPSLVDAYKSAGIWSNFSDRITAYEGE